MIKAIFFSAIFLQLTMCRTVSCGQESKSKSLNKLYEEYSRASILTNTMANAFFKAFPNSFNELQSIYGYDDKGFGPGYDVYKEHITLFFKTAKYVDSATFTAKLVKISLNGKWYADGVNLFRSNMIDCFFAKPNLFLNFLSKYNSQQIWGFWYFFLDGPVFNEQVYNKVNAKLKFYPDSRKTIYNIAQKLRKKSEKN